MLGKPSRRTRKKLEARGVRASAVVVEIAESGMSISSGQTVSRTEMLLRTKLRVEPLEEPPFEVEGRFRYPQLEIPTVGSRLTVLYDPSDHDTLIIGSLSAAEAARPGPSPVEPKPVGPGAGLSAPAAPSADPLDKLERLQELREKGALTEAEFAAQKARILGGG